MAVTGKLEMIVGTMRSNKTAELLRRIETRRQYAKQYVMLLKPSADTKSAEGVVESRNPNGCGKMEAVEFHSADPWTVLPVLAAKESRLANAWSASLSMRASLFMTCLRLRGGCWKVDTM
jgi:thymidine kinase